MVTIDDIAAGVFDRTGGAFLTAIPGKAWFGRVDENAASPYAVFGIERGGPPEFFSDGSYLQEWTLRMGAYTDQGVQDPNAVQLAIATAINTDPTSWSALREGRVLHCLPQGWDGRFAPELRHARDVFVAGGQWTLLIEGNLEA